MTGMHASKLSPPHTVNTTAMWLVVTASSHTRSSVAIMAFEAMINSMTTKQYQVLVAIFIRTWLLKNAYFINMPCKVSNAYPGTSFQSVVASRT
eukprot:m.51402 g.51402  ORF g.51402 m.51402 type:complete len:94 (-) comp21439_c0_seq1:238-519(-)